jgi:hypothetical protein
MQDVAVPVKATVSDTLTKGLDLCTHHSFRSHLHSRRQKAIGCLPGRYKLASASILDKLITHYVFANAPVAADVCPIGW